jgi:glutamine synthetase
MNPIEGLRFANWQRGFGDFHMVPDFSTARVASWMPKTALVLCDLHDAAGKDIAIAPRSILRSAAAAAAAAAAVAFSGSA